MRLTGGLLDERDVPAAGVAPSSCGRAAVGDLDLALDDEFASASASVLSAVNAGAGVSL